MTNHYGYFSILEVELFSFVCRNIVNNYGMWDQICVDMGREWYLMLAVQQSLEQFRNDTSKRAYVQTSSKQVSHDCKHVVVSLHMHTLAKAQVVADNGLYGHN